MTNPCRPNSNVLSCSTGLLAWMWSRRSSYAVLLTRSWPLEPFSQQLQSCEDVAINETSQLPHVAHVFVEFRRSITRKCNRIFHALNSAVNLHYSCVASFPFNESVGMRPRNQPQWPNAEVRTFLYLCARAYSYNFQLRTTGQVSYSIGLC